MTKDICLICNEIKENNGLIVCDECNEYQPNESMRDNNPCDDCNSERKITLEPYGSSYMAVISCPNCGESYDTNLDDSEIQALKGAN